MHDVWCAGSDIERAIRLDKFVTGGTLHALSLDEHAALHSKLTAGVKRRVTKKEPRPHFTMSTRVTDCYLFEIDRLLALKYPSVTAALNPSILTTVRT